MNQTSELDMQHMEGNGLNNGIISGNEGEENKEAEVIHPRLNFELLLELFERLIFKSKFTAFETVNMFKGPKADLLRINPRCFDAIISTISKCEKLFYFYSKAYNEDEVETYKLHRYQEHASTDPSPLLVSSDLVLGLLVHGQLRITSLISNDVFSAYEDLGRYIPPFISSENNTQTFSKIFLHRKLKEVPKYKIGPGLPFEGTEEEIKLNLNTLELEDKYIALQHIGHILNLNACRMDLNFVCRENDRYFPLPEITSTRANASSTKEITVVISYDSSSSSHDGGCSNLQETGFEFHADEWANFLNYILDSCPHLDQVEITIKYEKQNLSLTPMLIRYTQVVRGMVEKVFPALREDTHTKIKVIIYSYPDAYEAKAFSLDEHELGSISVADDSTDVRKGTISRLCLYRNAVDTQHKCIFRFFQTSSETDDEDENSVIRQMIYDDNLDFTDQSDYELNDSEADDYNPTDEGEYSDGNDYEYGYDDDGDFDDDEDNY